MSEEAEQGRFDWMPFQAKLALAGCVLIGLSTMFLTTINNSIKVAFYAGVGVTGLSVGVILLLWALISVMDA